MRRMWSVTVLAGISVILGDGAMSLFGHELRRWLVTMHGPSNSTALRRGIS